MVTNGVLFLKIMLPVDFIGISVKMFLSMIILCLHDFKYLQITFQFNIHIFLSSHLRSWLFKGRTYTLGNINSIILHFLQFTDDQLQTLHPFACWTWESVTLKTHILIAHEKTGR